MKLSTIVLITAIALSFTLCLACGGNGETGDAQSAQGVKLGQPVEFTIKTFEGDTLKPEDFRGKVLMVDYWATWCAPCRAEFPHFEELLKTYPDDIAIIGITTDEDLGALTNFLAKNPQKFIVGMYAQSSTPSWWENPPAMPTTFFIDRDGILVSFVKGGHDFKGLFAEVEPLLNKPASTTVPAEDADKESVEPSTETPETVPGDTTE